MSCKTDTCSDLQEVDFDGRHFPAKHRPGTKTQFALSLCAFVLCLKLLLDVRRFFQLPVSPWVDSSASLCSRCLDERGPDGRWNSG